VKWNKLNYINDIIITPIQLLTTKSTMGIHLLQTFLTSLRDKSVVELHLSTLNGKKITVDISIYLYRFKEMGNLIENLYLMCSIFRYYNIHPIFIFDGKSLPIKHDVIVKRREDKQKAKKEFENLKVESHAYTGDSKKNAQMKLDNLRKKFISITKDDIYIAKALLDAYGMTYITARHEADELCGALSFENNIYACMTEDTDIMVYGCRRILRYFSLIKHTVVLYDMKIIMNNLSITLNDFQELCVCAGNDYIKTSRNLFYYYKLFNIYKKSSKNGFLEWLLKKRYLSLQEYHERIDIHNMYIFKTYDPFEGLPYILVKNKNINKKNLIAILEKGGFVFP